MMIYQNQKYKKRMTPLTGLAILIFLVFPVESATLQHSGPGYYSWEEYNPEKKHYSGKVHYPETAHFSSPEYFSGQGYNSEPRDGSQSGFEDEFDDIPEPCDETTEDCAGEGENLVGIRVVPPFVIEEPDGTYSGLSIALWEHIAGELGLEFEYTERDIQGLIDGVSGETAAPLIAAVSALTITSERETLLDFSHPFFVTGLGIAVPYQPSTLWQAILGIFSIEFLWVVLLLILLLFFWGFLVWLSERRKNPEEFGGSTTEGIGSGFWWAAVTMTTVGYGDKAPRSLAGRMVGFVWMFAGIILISFFTASIASSLTVTRLDSRVSGPHDLPHVRTGALSHSATIDYLQEHHISHRTFDSISEGLQAVDNQEIDAFVHDAPIIRYISTREFTNRVRVLPFTFNEQYYGIALPPDSPLRNDINRILLDYIISDEWKALNRRYFGE